MLFDMDLLFFCETKEKELFWLKKNKKSFYKNINTNKQKKQANTNLTDVQYLNECGYLIFHN